uniref:Uncharacterized protein n=1 Tax=Cacopsylla melanoneura TaxID=428564 RepID=A0A8D8S3K3_9HEMI
MEPNSTGPYETLCFKVVIPKAQDQVGSPFGVNHSRMSSSPTTPIRAGAYCLWQTVDRIRTPRSFSSPIALVIIWMGNTPCLERWWAVWTPCLLLRRSRLITKTVPSKTLPSRRHTSSSILTPRQTRRWPRNEPQRPLRPRQRGRPHRRKSRRTKN